MGILRALYYIFECMLLTAAGPGLMKARLDLNTIFLIGLIHGLSLLGIRTLYQFYNIPFGTHTIILALILFLLLWQLAKLNWFTALSGTLISFTLLLLGEPLILLPLVKYFHISYDLAYNNILWFYILGLSGDCLLIITVIWNWLRNRIA